MSSDNSVLFFEIVKCPGEQKNFNEKSMISDKMRVFVVHKSRIINRTLVLVRR